MTEMSLSDVVPSSPNGPRRRSQRAAEKRRKRRKRRTWVTVLVTVLVLGGAGGAAWLGLRPILESLNTPNDFTGTGTSAVTVRIPDGASGSKIATILEQQGVVKSAKAYLDAAADTPSSASIQPGTYALKREMSAKSALQALLDPASRQLKRVTIPEGSRAGEILAKIAKDTGIPKAQLEAAAKDAKALGLPKEAKGQVEGFLFPATYDVEPGTSAADLLRTMVAKTEDTMAELGVAPKEQYRVLILASIVQAEGRHAEDMPKIARAMSNRIAINRPLEVDVTLLYALKKRTLRVTIADTKIPSPYNLYANRGLPPTPIGSPGQVAIEAVLNPAKGSWIFWVATNPETGLTKFATTEAEFAKIKAEYEAWQRAHPNS